MDVNNFHSSICEFVEYQCVLFPFNNTKTSFPFTLVHSDIHDPSQVSNASSAKWFVSFIDDYTRVTWNFLLKQKFEVSNIFPIFHFMIKIQFWICIKRVRIDNARDYFIKSRPHASKKRG